MHKILWFIYDKTYRSIEKYSICWNWRKILRASVQKFEVCHVLYDIFFHWQSNFFVLVYYKYNGTGWGTDGEGGEWNDSKGRMEDGNPSHQETIPTTKKLCWAPSIPNRYSVIPLTISPFPYNLPPKGASDKDKCKDATHELISFITISRYKW